MSWFNWFKRKKPTDYDFTDEDRQHSLQIRSINAEKKRLEREIEITRLRKTLYDLKSDMEEYDYDDEEETGNEETALTALLTSLLLNKANGGQSVQATQTPPNSKITLSQEQIDALIKENKQYIKIAKLMSDEQLFNVISSRAPEVSTESIQNAIKTIREW